MLIDQSILKLVMTRALEEKTFQGSSFYDDVSDVLSN